jgi:hypothetical protein
MASGSSTSTAPPTSQKPQIMIDRMVEIYGHKYACAEEGHSLSREATEAFEGHCQRKPRR